MFGQDVLSRLQGADRAYSPTTMTYNIAKAVALRCVKHSHCRECKRPIIPASIFDSTDWCSGCLDKASLWEQMAHVQPMALDLDLPKAQVFYLDYVYQKP